MSNSPRLEFYLDLPSAKSSALQVGYLLIKKDDVSAGIKIQATSGCRGNQYFGAWTLKGRGPLPPSSLITPHRYSVSTQRLWLPQVKGVEGSFYAIAPFMVRVGAVSRGDFGVHFDANAPGSAGCCVITQQAHWDLFRKLMEEFRDLGIQQLPLEVIYQ